MQSSKAVGCLGHTQQVEIGMVLNQAVKHKLKHTFLYNTKMALMKVVCS